MIKALVKTVNNMQGQIDNLEERQKLQKKKRNNNAGKEN